MTIKQWLDSATKALQDQGIASAPLDSQLLLAHALGKDKAYLIAHDDDLLPQADIDDVSPLLERRLKHEPIAYITQTKEFFGLPFTVGPGVLIPRWETELLVETAQKWLRDHPPMQVVCEVGTGCGAIILTLAHYEPDHIFLATEISEEAVAIARKNAHLTQTPRITIAQGDMFGPFAPSYAGKVTLLLANLPYIPEPLLKNLDSTVTYYEPHIALTGGEDGLDHYRRFMPEAKQMIAPGGMILCEHDFDQGETMQTLAQTYFPNATITTLQDGLGHDRVLSITTAV